MFYRKETINHTTDLILHMKLLFNKLVYEGFPVFKIKLLTRLPSVCFLSNPLKVTFAKSLRNITP